MEPNPVHIEKIANALSVPSIVLYGTNEMKLKLNNIGDIYNFIFTMCKSNFIVVFIKNDQVLFNFNPVLLENFVDDKNKEIKSCSYYKFKENSDLLLEWAELYLSAKEAAFKELSNENQISLLDKLEEIEIKLIGINETLKI